MSLWYAVHGIEASYPPPTWEAAAYLGSHMPLPGDTIVSLMRVVVSLTRVDLQVHWGTSSRSGPALDICCRAASWVDSHHRYSPLSESSCVEGGLADVPTVQALYVRLVRDRRAAEV